MSTAKARGSAYDAQVRTGDGGHDDQRRELEGRVEEAVMNREGIEAGVDKLKAHLDAAFEQLEAAKQAEKGARLALEEFDGSAQ